MDVAVLMRKTFIGGNSYLFRPVQAMTGVYDNVFNEFTSNQGISYLNMSDNSLLQSEEEMCFGYPMDMEELGIDIDESSACYIYFEEFKDKICIGIYDFNKCEFDSYIMSEEEFRQKHEDHFVQGEQDVFPSEYISNRLEVFLDEANHAFANPNEESTQDIADILTTLSNFIFAGETIDGISVNDVDEETANLVMRISNNISKKAVKKWPNNFKFVNKNGEPIDNTEAYFSSVGNSSVVPKPNSIADKRPEIITKSNNSLVFNVKEISDEIKKAVIAQDEPIDRISIQLYKRMIQLSLPREQRGKFGMLVTGSTGVGKTEIFNTFASMVDLPILKIDSTQLTKPGYQGKNIEDYLLELYDREHGNKERVSKAIVIFDEIDKKNAKGGEDVSGKAVQDVILKLMDGTNYTFKRDMLSPQPISVDTHDMTIISLGAFSELYHTETKHIGIGVVNEDNKKIATLDDFKNYGMTEEFIGRHPIMIHLNDLTEKDLETILRISSRSPLLVQDAIFKELGVKLTFTDDYIKKAANVAAKYKTGARSLVKVVEESTWKPIEDISSNPGVYNELVLTDKTIENPKIFTLKRY